ncbi:MULTISPECIES: trans-aconitate 2-methyltransferase [unclassified Streptomyces]|uniref:trans-aconitate 2-methyltransferase n=1 Tax=unclassified Streptomyces TaxID=2593676 RepID=UPI000B8A48A9|nr:MULTISPECIES: trans-aconitate 2-methyltransferase [unclassified Streptomyces]MYS21073.1 trans-aconitate 2-methyltransferase [Streptomyces sp. SID4948]
MQEVPTWDPQQYLRHATHRTRPFDDLLARITGLPGGRAPRIADIGCGPGNVTVRLADRWPGARITGFDTSPEMLDAAAAHAGPTPGGGSLDFERADAADWTPARGYDLIVSNAALQWVPGHAERFPVWLDGITPGGTLAFQVPGNFDAPSHTLLAELCETPRWRGLLGGRARRAMSVLSPAAYLERLVGLGYEAVDVWETTYAQLLTGPDPVLEWTRGTALRPVLTALDGDDAAAAEFVRQYRDLLREAYPAGPHGTVFPFRRIFAVARTPGQPAPSRHPEARRQPERLDHPDDTRAEGTTA